MALKATRAVPVRNQAEVSEAQETQNQQAVQEAVNTQPAPAPAPVPSTAKPVSPNELQLLNEGVLEGIDDLNIGGNYVTVDGTQFLYKTTEETRDYIDIVVTYGKRFYQWVDESDPNAKRFYNSDKKLDERYKLKFEIRWLEDRGEEEPIEFTQTLSTTSAMNFISYIKMLAKAGLGVNQVVTRMTVSRQQSRDKAQRYSRVEFEAFDLAAYQAGELKPLGIRTPGAREIQ